MMTVDELTQFLHREFAEAFDDGGFTISRVAPGAARLTQRYHPKMLRPGGTVSGPTLMALADIALYVAVLSAIGPVGLAVTTQLNVKFLRKAPAGADLIADAKLLKTGRRLAMGEVSLFSAGSEQLIAHVTGTYSIP
jgi:uncharacterized protein (TIGR00369 family)